MAVTVEGPPIEEWPRWAWMALGLAFSAISTDVHVWRRSWIRSARGSIRNSVWFPALERALD